MMSRCAFDKEEEEEEDAPMVESIPNANQPRIRTITVDPEYGEAFTEACGQLKLTPQKTINPDLERMSGPRIGSAPSMWNLNFPNYQAEQQFYQTYNQLTAQAHRK